MALLVTGALPLPALGVNSPPRREITNFVADNRQFSLYIQALRTIYARDPADRASYFQISGIHGMPYVDWNGSPSGNRGYCVHRTQLFPTWHRPYVVLFEQEVQRVAREIAETYTTDDKPDWQGAAANLRQPYWGWDSLATSVPPLQVTTMQTVPITGPDGVEIDSPNPFFDYRFPDGATAGFPAPYVGRQRTLRHPLNGVSNPDNLRAALQAVAQQTVDNTENLFGLNTWAQFTLGGAGTLGLESIHDTLHMRSSGPGGHMSSVPVAAFDPIFWLHHSQLDRIIDRWFEQHPQAWINNNQNLVPFRNTQATYWTSQNIQNTGISFNYTFAEPEALVVEDQAAPPGQPPGEHQAADEQMPESSESAPAQNPGPGQPPSSTGSVNPGETSGSTMLRWSAQINCKQFEIGGSFSVFVFLGDVPPVPEKWLTDPALAGTFDVFANETPDECANCNEQRDLVLHGFVQLNRAILRLSKEKSLEKDAVLRYFKDRGNLNWGIQKADGSIASVREIPSLEVTIQCMPLTLPVGAKYPTEGEPQFYHEITAGRPGGHRDSNA